MELNSQGRWARNNYEWGLMFMKVLWLRQFAGFEIPLLGIQCPYDNYSQQKQGNWLSQVSQFAFY